MPESPPLAVQLLAASEVIAEVLSGHNLDAALGAVSAPLRPAVQGIAYDTLRHFGRGDFFLGRLLQSPLQNSQIRALLLAALCRLETREDDAHTTVDQAVNAAQMLAGGRFKGLVNGVLRNFLRQQPALILAAAQDEVARWQHPRWWIKKLRRSYPQTWQRMLATGNTRPPMTLRVNQRRSSGSDYLLRLHQQSIGARALDDYAIQLEQPRAVSGLPGFFDGAVSVQDWGAQHAAQWLDADPGMRILDACAAPGGKTAHLLEMRDVDVTALDVDAARLMRVAENLGRLALRATLRQADCRDLTAWWDGKLFDRVIADVPCSASGVVRRHPDAKWLRRESDSAKFATMQAEILDALWRVLVPGGKMLYCTCSVFAEENSGQVAAFVARHPDAERCATGGSEVEHQFIPGADHDGFYYALVTKRR
jgi:16S rRNA (cytosine967-C5)-methyltransferase